MSYIGVACSTRLCSTCSCQLIAVHDQQLVKQEDFFCPNCMQEKLQRAEKVVAAVENAYSILNGSTFSEAIPLPATMYILSTTRAAEDYRKGT